MSIVEILIHDPDHIRQVNSSLIFCSLCTLKSTNELYKWLCCCAVALISIGFSTYGQGNTAYLYCTFCTPCKFEKLSLGKLSLNDTASLLIYEQRPHLVREPAEPRQKTAKEYAYSLDNYMLF